MGISRKKFILSGLLSVAGLLYWKTHTVGDDDIESFFSNYESAIPVEDLLNTKIQIYLFEEKLFAISSFVVGWITLYMSFFLWWGVCIFSDYGSNSSPLFSI